MSRPDYFDKYSLIRFKREDGILEMQLHTDGKEMEWDYASRPNAQLEQAFLDIGRDPDNGVVIFTGAGNRFTGPEAPRKSPGSKPQYSGRPWQTVFDELHHMMNNLLAIPVPMIAAVNGPAMRHCELPMLCDIVLASDDTFFQDSAHYTGGLVPGDGKHIVFPLLMGINRARYFMLTGQKMSAQEAQQIGVVNEVMSRAALSDRAWALARELMLQSPSVRRYTRLLLTEKIRREFNENLSLGAALEGLGIWADL